MNKKFLICGAIVTTFLVSACVEKEAPKDKQESASTTTTAASEPQQPAQFENLPAQPGSIPAVTTGNEPTVSIERTETAHTTTEIRTTTPAPSPSHESHQSERTEQSDSRPAKAESARPEQPAQAVTPKAPTGALSEDDAVAAAIAAAGPALKN